MRLLLTLCLMTTPAMLLAQSPTDHIAESSPVTALACPPAGGSHHAGVDKDVDGIPDSEDRCLSTRAGASVGPDGCTLGEMRANCAARTVAAAPARAPAGAKDSDGDGVADEADRCPGTPRGSAVDGAGCVQIEKVVLRGVNFATGSAVLKPAAHDTLRTVAQAMRVNPALEVEVGGHTDSLGDDAKNQALSERRAEAVKAFLVKEGVAADRLTTRGYGETQPADTNDTAEGRANNRRVAFKVTDR